MADSKPLACLLLSLSNMHPAAPQMALDMLCRIDAKEEMQVVLFSENQIMSALKLAEKDSINPRKFLNAAKSTDNHILFHSVLFHFRNNPQFAESFKKSMIHD